VLTARSGREAVETVRVRGEEVGVVLLDVMMPGMGGEETLRELRGLRPALRVLAMSGFPEQEASTRLAGQGLDGFVQKPWQAADLVARLRRLLGGEPG
jgi:DNA-binding response OmpR family regulator